MMFLVYLFLLPQVINFFLALIPTLFLLNYFYKRDPRPEPRRTVMKAFFLGIGATIPAVILELILSRLEPAGISRLASLAFHAFIVAGLVEEGCKMFMVKRYIYPLPEFDEVTDGIIYTMAAGLGFAFLENILYSMNSAHPWSVLLMRGVTAVPLHGLTSGIMGYYIGRSKFEDRSSMMTGLLIAILYHGLYDFFLFTGTALAWLTIPLLIILFLHAKHLLGEAIREDHRFFRS